ncbi:coil containing protein [Vibrio phage 2.117.O._10N.261.45.E9]|nr:coil containing protein [Vibrio phage 1.117.O._10N.261.45.E9]AUR95421.1 coil containing protein [Vibrio phage 1.207.B._10N.222.51.C2]AUS02312.1 coil containing protein [Vibrio phage 2.117.O._10N.261.45.E9]
MSNRRKAKTDILTYLRDCNPEVFADCINTPQRHIIIPEHIVEEFHDMLECVYGYQVAGTRRCIINEALREAQLSKPRDTYKRRVYRFEDLALARALPASVTDLISEERSFQIIDETCRLLGIEIPAATFNHGGHSSCATLTKATGLCEIFIRADMQNALTLIHELCHCYQYVGDAHNCGHSAQFMAVELACLSRFTNVPLADLILLASQHRIPVDLRVAKLLHQSMGYVPEYLLLK